MFGKKSVAQRLSRQTRQYRTHLNRIYEQNLDEHVEHIFNQYKRNYVRLQAEQKLEQQRKQVLHLTFRHHTNELERPLMTSAVLRSPSPRQSCDLFSHNCQLYPCQPIYHYQSFVKPEHDRTLRQRTSSDEISQPISNSSYLQNILNKVKDKHYEHNRRHLTAMIQNQSHRAHQHVHIQRTMNHLNEQSQILHERLNDRKRFGYAKEHQHELQQAIRRHLTISAKFYG